MTKIYDNVVSASYDIDIDLESCDCEARLRFSLPCRHILIPFARDEMEFIPLRLVHPRWRLKPRFSNDYFVAPRDWKPSYQDQTLRLSLKKADLWLSLDEVLQRRDALPLGERERFTDHVQTNLSSLLQAARTAINLANLPLTRPDAIPKNSFKRKHGENSRALTAVELLEQREREAEREESQRERDRQIIRRRALEESQAWPSQGLEFINAAFYEHKVLDISDLEPSTPPSAQPPPPPPPPKRAPSPPPSTSEPPPSTAPARLTGSGRERKKTARLEAAQKNRWLPESQERQPKKR